jgi:MSHA pilin protein MshA
MSGALTPSPKAWAARHKQGVSPLLMKPYACCLPSIIKDIAAPNGGFLYVAQRSPHMPPRPSQPEFSVCQQKAGLLRPGQRGFTIIELTCVIVIVGCLAATALPKFVNLTTEANIAAVRGMEASLSTASNLLRGACASSSKCDLTSGAADVTVNGISFGFWNGWIDAGDAGRNEIDKALVSYNGFTLQLLTEIHRFTLNSAKTPASCYAQYQEARKAGDTPVISSVVTGC